MSNSKYRYYTVTTSRVVRANNQGDALTVAEGKKADAQVLHTESSVERIPATEAKLFTA